MPKNALALSGPSAGRFPSPKSREYQNPIAYDDHGNVVTYLEHFNLLAWATHFCRSGMVFQGIAAPA
jgi:hypothetical protein